MDALAVADEKQREEKKPEGKKPAKGPKPDYTTLRFFAQDGEEISDLADKEGITIAELYNRLCAPIIRKRLIVKTEEQLRKLKAHPES